tara:strand:- start:8085 stop:8330 length:246 start_codon:yes stop_codon:yes gene_type:complete
MEIKLSGRWERQINNLIETDDFDSPEMVIKIALCILDDEMKVRAEKLKVIRNRIQESMDDPVRIPFNKEEFKKRSRERNSD